MLETLGPLGAAVAAVPSLIVSPAALAGLAALGVLLATYGALAMRQPGLVAQRLGTAGIEARSLEDLELQLSFRDRVLAPVLRACARLVLRYTPQSTLEGYRQKLVLAGSPGSLEVRDLVGIKGFLGVGLPVALLLVSGVARVVPAPLALLALAALGFKLPDFMLAKRIARRQLEIQKALPDTLDLLTICVEAGLGFDAAIGRVVEKRDDQLSREFGRVLTEMRMGRARRDALRTMIDRIGLQDITTFVSAIVQSEQLGVPISRVLLTQAEQMRIRRSQRAEEAAHKAPIKMLFPMVFLIFPAMFVVILGPAMPGILNMMN